MCKNAHFYLRKIDFQRMQHTTIPEERVFSFLHYFVTALKQTQQMRAVPVHAQEQLKSMFFSFDTLLLKYYSYFHKSKLESNNNSVIK